MYGYSFDAETGGLLLNDSVGQTSLEPRPVYAPEMDALGFGDHWNYERQSDVPILWAEAENYTYRGKRIARTRGGKLHEKPALEPLVDKETGVNYLYVCRGYGGGLTPLLDADGKPIITKDRYLK